MVRRSTSRNSVAGHDLDHLGGMVATAGMAVPEALADAMRRLTRHYIPARYPDAHPGGQPGQHYGASYSEQAIDDATAILAFVDETWGALDGDQGD